MRGEKQEENRGHGMDEEGSERVGIEKQKTGLKYGLHPIRVQMNWGVLPSIILEERERALPRVTC